MGFLAALNPAASRLDALRESSSSGLAQRALLGGQTCEVTSTREFDVFPSLLFLKGDQTALADSFSTLLQSFRYSQVRRSPDPSFDTAVVGPVQPAPLGGLFLIDLQFLAHATDRAAKTDADIE